MTKRSVALLASLSLVAGCAGDPRRGYSFTSAYRDDVRTVHVPIFDNRTFDRGVEVELTDAVIKEIQRSTPWRVVSAHDADTTLSGEVTGSELRALSRARVSGLVQEQQVALTVSFAWTDNRTGRPLAARANFQAAEVFVPSRGVGERVEAGRNMAIQELARDIVAELRGSW